MQQISLLPRGRGDRGSHVYVFLLHRIGMRQNIPAIPTPHPPLVGRSDAVKPTFAQKNLHL